MNIDIKKISRASHLANDLGMDSFGAIEVMFEIEERFGIEVDEKELTNIKTVGDMVNYIKGKTNA
jgi:acyl carrier protein